MLPDRVSNPEPLTYESGALPIVVRGPALLLFRAATHKRELYKYANSKYSDQPTHLRSLIRALAVCKHKIWIPSNPQLLMAWIHGLAWVYDLGLHQATFLHDMDPLLLM